MKRARESISSGEADAASSIDENPSQSLQSTRNARRKTTATGSSDVCNSVLCFRCASLDIERIAPNKHRLCQVLELGPLPDTLAASPCALCRLFWSCKIDQSSFDPKRVRPGYVVMFVSKYWKSGVMQGLGSGQLCVTMIPRRCKTRLAWDISYNSELRGRIGIVDGEDVGVTQSFFPVAKVPALLHDFDFLQKCIKDCERSHKAECSASPKKLAWPKQLVLISCKERRLVQVQSRVKYAALSYVWGHTDCNSIPCAISQRLPSNLPLLVEDAIFAALQCGIEYLWIDRYCIDQNKAAYKHDQIGQMDLIYSNAFVTMIDAAESSPEIGLCGISFNSRIPQARAQVGKFLLASTLSNPHILIERCPWSRRGWTYQEAFFSKRRIYFTKEQIYWECGTSVWYESTPLVCRKKGDGLLGRVNNERPWSVFEHLSKYSQRQLSCQSDAIHAFAGLLHHFEGQTLSVRSLMGVPIMPDVIMGKYGGVESGHISQSTRLAAGLCWVNCVRSRRRESFPSWSWAGWQGEVSYSFSCAYPYGSILQGREGDFINIRLEDGEGGLIDFDTYDLDKLADTNPWPSSRFIHIEAYAVPIRIEKRPHSLENGICEVISGYFAIFEDAVQRLEVAVFLPTCIHPDDNPDLHLTFGESTDGILGLVLGGWTGHGTRQSTRKLVMLVQDNGTHFVRVGHMWFNRGHMRLVPKSGQSIDVPTSIPLDAELPWELCFGAGSKRSVRLG